MIFSLINQSIWQNSEEAISGSNWFYQVREAKIEQQQQTISFLQGILPTAESSMAAALFLGDRTHLSSVQKQWVEIAGLQHILAVSGYHLAILTSIIRQYTGFILRKSWVVGIVCIMFGGWYALLTGFSPSMARALGMMLLRVVGKTFFHRQVSAFISLIVVCLVSLLLERELFDSLSFQFSYLATLGIIVITPLLYSRRNVIADREIGILLPEKSQSMSKKIGQSFVQAFVVSLAAQLILTPLILYHFERFSVLGILTSTAFFWFIEIIFSTGIMTVFLTTALNWLGAFFSFAQHAAQLASLLLWICLNSLNRLLSSFAQWQWTVVQIDSFPQWAVLLWWAGLFSVVLAVWHRRRVAFRYQSLTAALL